MRQALSLGSCSCGDKCLQSPALCEFGSHSTKLASHSLRAMPSNIMASLGPPESPPQQPVGPSSRGDRVAEIGFGQHGSGLVDELTLAYVFGLSACRYFSSHCPSSHTDDNTPKACLSQVTCGHSDVGLETTTRKGFIAMPSPPPPTRATLQHRSPKSHGHGMAKIAVQPGSLYRR